MAYKYVFNVKEEKKSAVCVRSIISSLHSSAKSHGNEKKKWNMKRSIQLNAGKNWKCTEIKFIHAQRNGFLAYIHVISNWTWYKSLGKNEKK